jgi:hypothetical protein
MKADTEKVKYQQKFLFKQAMKNPRNLVRRSLSIEDCLE